MFKLIGSEISILIIVPAYSFSSFYIYKEGSGCFYRGKINERHFKEKKSEKNKKVHISVILLISKK